VPSRNVRERQPAASGAEGADDGERAAQVQRSRGAPAPASVGLAQGAALGDRAAPAQGNARALLPVPGSLQRPRLAAGALVSALFVSSSLCAVIPGILAGCRFQRCT
jgi:hypothetical protein